MKVRRRRSAKVMRSIQGQMNSNTVARSGSGSDLLFGLKMRYDLAAPQERDSTEVQTEKIWGPLTLPVLNIITTWVTDWGPASMLDSAWLHLPASSRSFSTSRWSLELNS